MVLENDIKDLMDKQGEKLEDFWERWREKEFMEDSCQEKRQVIQAVI